MPIITRWLGSSLLLALLTTGCMPSYHVTVRPATEAARWVNGREMVVMAADSLEAEVGVVSTIGPWTEFDVTVRNTSRGPVLVAPEQFYVLVSFPATKTTAPAQVRVTADDPEAALQTMTQEAEHHTQKSTAVPAAELLSTVSSVVQDLSSNKRKETTEQYNARQAAYQAEMNRYEQERTDHAVRAASLREDIRHAEQTLLRKTTLDPGYALQGRVRFRSWYYAADKLQLVLPLDGHALAADFVQTAYRMDGTQPAVARTPVVVPAVQPPAGLNPPVPPAPATVRP
ncbi:hypothetical protein [Hymenobacter sp. CRA2]|uniref:hypothetical protein n=1 Tax=Hymenobacter sp. CRA2 TaxID=1955620 RepID=UPI00098F8D59|nr:hypothetical protein [Hymenobacter sp. CRA2]OON68603.1 hypothetical protein B0919_13265 [Hymenobacter sp. CRA2]